MASGHAVGEYGDLVRVLINSSSPVEASLAVVMLRDRIQERDLVSLCNLRELIALLPTVPFATPAELSVLERRLGYERAGASWTLPVGSANALSGLEFLGDGNRVDSVVLRRGDTRIQLTGHTGDFIEPAAIDALLADEMLGIALVEALDALGVGISPRYYMSVTDYVLDNTVAALDDIGKLF